MWKNCSVSIAPLNRALLVGDCSSLIKHKSPPYNNSNPSMLRYIVLLTVGTQAALAQTDLTWRLLPSAPFLSTSRQDDAFFISERTGWVVNGRGQIWKTTDGGGTWAQQLDTSTVYFRCVGFSDSLHGWACNLGTEEFGGATDTNIIFQTTNSGVSWFANNTIGATKPRGLCGMHAVTDSCIYAVGRVRGPAYFLRSTDAGTTWQSRIMSTYAYGLLDCYFFTADSGLAVGHTGNVNETSSGVVLFTSDRGTTWSVRYTTSRVGEWCWKINFPTRQTGYVSLQRNAGSPVTFLKTTDGGVTWQEKQLSATPYYVQGIGFADVNHGWVGGNTSLPTLETTDGGDSWHPLPFGVRVNRFRMLNDTVGYSVGQGVYKYSRELPAAVTESPATGDPTSFALLELYPNPFNSETTIRFSVGGAAEDPATPLRVTIAVVDLLGKQVSLPVDAEYPAGHYSTRLDGSALSTGVYFVHMTVAPGHDDAPLVAGKYTDTKKLLLLK